MENLNSAMNSFSEQSKKINIAMHYLNNDMEKAKMMVAGKLKDIVIVKGTFSSSSLYGAFILFFNYLNLILADSSFLVSPDYSISGIKNSADWKVFEKEIVEIRNRENSRVSGDFKEKFDAGFTLTFSREFAKMIKAKDTTQLTYILQKYLTENSGLKRLALNLEYQTASSLEMELDSVTSKKLDKKIIEKKKEDEKKAEADAETDSSKDENSEPVVGQNGIKLIIKSTLVLSPIKGKYISKVEPGDRVMVTMVEKNPQTVQIAQAFKAYNQETGVISSIPGRVLKVDYIDNLGYKLYVVIAKGIIAQVIEEETNIKVALDPAQTVNQQSDDEKTSRFGLPIIISLVAAIIVSLMIIVLTIF
ncbi:MAG: hypothetical protein JW982_08660 [Spirochaetes bacterium]|nr:hypothetical protein [Spirochaetota bacterium]